MNIVMATYPFDKQRVFIAPYEVVKETDKCYHVQAGYKTKRIPKNEINKVVKLAGYKNKSPYLRLSMVDASHDEIQKKLGSWFTDEANRIAGKNKPKNVREAQLKKCIFMESEDFSSLINNVTGGLKTVEFCIDGILYLDSDKADKFETYWNEEITETLSKYFNAEVTSVHADDCDQIGVWIAYRE